MFDVIVLVCALGVQPSECQPPTALRQIYLGTVPERAPICGDRCARASRPGRDHGSRMVLAKTDLPQTRG